jgi:serine/threonine-protein kinase HipA
MHATDFPGEYFTMRLTKVVELEVPEVRRMYVPEPVYLVVRFDRLLVKDAKDAKAVQRRHVIDTCQLPGEARTFAPHLDSLTQAVGWCRSRAAARLQLYRWIVLNVLTGNN